MKKRSIQMLALSIMLIIGLSIPFSILQLSDGKTSKGLPVISAVHDPILISSNLAMDTFFAGNGTDGLSWETAYTLENLIIDAGGIGSPVRIENTDRYLIIRNCSLTGAEFTNGEAGAAFYNVQNLRIVDCYVHFNNFLGIYFFNSSFNEIIVNDIGNNTHGISFENNSNFNYLADNFIDSENGNGIFIENSSFITVSNNQIYGASHGISVYSHSMYSNLTDNKVENSHIGINVDVHSNHTTIDYNTIDSCFDGIVLNTSSHGTIKNNAVFGSRANGILLNNISDTSVSGNQIENSLVGLYVFDSIRNSIFMNKFSDCSYSSAVDNGINNWNNSKFGNYWGDYEIRYPGASTDDERIWNTPYQINSTSLYDYRPMVATGKPYVTTPGNRTNVEGGHCSLLYWRIFDTTILGSGNYIITRNGVFWEKGQWKDQDFIELVSDYLPVGVHVFKLTANDGTRFGVVEDIIQMTITPFGTPVLTTNSQSINERSILIQWDIVPDADLYYLYLNDEFYNVVAAPATEMLVEFEEEGTYSIYITAINGVLESDPSNIITITVEERKIPGFSYLIPLSLVGIVSLVVLLKKRIREYDY
jgi:parallel beta-helix repeat protein